MYRYSISYACTEHKTLQEINKIIKAKYFNNLKNKYTNT